MAERAQVVRMRREEDPNRKDRRRPQADEAGIASLMGFEAGTLAIMASVHLAGYLRGSKPFRPDDAGIAEAVICAALIAGAAALVRHMPHSWSIAVATTGFAILGFLVGLSFTLRGGDAIDIAYHATVLPLLLLTMVVLLRRKGRVS